MPSARGFARRLHGDAELRGEVAAALGVDLTSFDKRGPMIIAGADGLGMFPRIGEVAEFAADRPRLRQLAP